MGSRQTTDGPAAIAFRGGAIDTKGEPSISVIVSVLLVSLLASIVALALLAHRYLSLFRQLKEAVHREAVDRFRERRDGELEVVRDQEREQARAEAGLEFETWKSDFERSIRQDAIQKSRSVTIGKVAEHIVPYLPEFRFNPKDARFIGSPIDLVVFDGLDQGEVARVVFIEVKTGASALTGRERLVRDAILAGRVQWEELRPAWVPSRAPRL